MNNNMNENTKVTKDIEETKVTMENVEERDVSGIMSIINEATFDLNIHCVQNQQELHNAKNTRDNVNDMFIKIRDIIYNDVISKHDILCMTQSEYYTDICNKHNITTSVSTVFGAIFKPFVFDTLMHVQTFSNMTLLSLDEFHFRLHELVRLKPIVIKEELDMFIYLYMNECVIYYSDQDDNNDCIDVVIDKFKRDFELVLRYTNARIQVLHEYCDTVLKLGEEYDDEQERFGFYQNCVQRLIDSNYGEIKSIYVHDNENCRVSFIPYYTKYELIQYIKSDPIIKLILEKCNFDNYELLKYLYFVNFNPLIKYFRSLILDDNDETNAYIDLLNDFMDDAHYTIINKSGDMFKKWIDEERFR